MAVGDGGDKERFWGDFVNKNIAEQIKALNIVILL